MNAEFHVHLSEAIDLDATLLSGQAFTWKRHNSSYEGLLAGIPATISPVPNNPGELLVKTVSHEGVSPQAVANYFDDGTNYSELRNELRSLDPFCDRAIEYSPGLRLLRQDPWETLVCFILSSCNNVPRITGIVHRLTQLSSRHFPSPEDIVRAGESKLRQAGAGFRAPYLIEAAKMVLDGTVDLAGLRSLPTDEAVKVLMTLPGVGRKVASCVALYGLHKCDAFPIDVWIKKVLQQAYFGGREVELPKLEQFARKHFGSKAGYAQNWLYNWARRSRLADISSATRSRME
ncbi:MAG TPA: DNA-3-methyladenine glycosylase 2 [Firmicutes bacterium]|nr:DNA-3-methyladenine glycosylase 2 [Bacillota bacterium]